VANFFKPKAQKQPSGQEIKIKINRLDINGTGVGSYQKKPVFVDGVLPDEVIHVKLIEQKNKFYKAKLISVESASEQRIEAKCQHFSRCGGCDLQHFRFAAHIDFKKQKVTDLFARSGITADLPWQNAIISEPWHYRRKARIGVQYDKKGTATIGFRQKSTNQLVKIKQCHVLVEPLSNIFPILNEILPQLSGKDSIGHIEVIATDKTSLVIRQLSKLSAKDESVWLAYAQKYQWQLFFDNGSDISTLCEVMPLTYQINEKIKLTFTVNNFIQVNHQVNQLMVKQAIDWLALNKNDHVLDLFCGLGNFTLPIADIAASVVGIEGVDNMVVQASENAKLNSIDNCQFYQANLNSDWQNHDWAKQSFDKVLLDPARAGAFEAIGQLVKLNIKQVLYVSCDSTTLAKDSALLISHGYSITKIALVDMFSQTKHIETMVLFTR